MISIMTQGNRGRYPIPLSMVQLEVRVKKQGENGSVICEWSFVIRQQLETQYSPQRLKTHSLQLDPKKN
jgi:hypothetical protein